MIDLEQRSGPWTVRVWGLILNFIGNALAIYGAIGVIRDGSRLPFLLIGGCITLLCIAVFSKPSSPSH